MIYNFNLWDVYPSSVCAVSWSSCLLYSSHCYIFRFEEVGTTRESTFSVEMEYRQNFQSQTKYWHILILLESSSKLGEYIKCFCHFEQFRRSVCYSDTSRAHMTIGLKRSNPRSCIPTAVFGQILKESEVNTVRGNYPPPQLSFVISAVWEIRLDAMFKYYKYQ